MEARRRMRDDVRGLLGPVGRNNSWQLAEYAGHATPHSLQHLLSRSRWDADGLQTHVADQLGHADSVLILDDTGFVKKCTASAGVQRQYSGTTGRTENC
ncbi:transposase [Streptomyces sp. NPDC093097]|uniref:transposase n=1 Tax=Streptomyces sp. NPDC093097 TaxID=3366027 RepID=UPI00381D133B